MKSHLAIVGKSGNLALKPDASITVIEKNPMFNNVEMHSYPFELPFEQNRHLIKNMDDVNSTLRAQDVDGEPFAIISDGIRLRNTVMKVQSDVVLKDALSVNLDATQKTFKDMIQDMKCRDVSVDDDILIGEKIGDVIVNFKYSEKYVTLIDCFAGQYVEGYEITMKQDSFEEVFQPVALGYSYPAECYEDATTHEAEPAKNSNGTDIVKTYKNTNKDATGNIVVKVPKIKTSYINVSKPYPQAKYCNTQICYAHHAAGQEDNGKYTGETSDEIVKSKDREKGVTEDKSPYWVLPAARPASGLCFYVAYFLERLFKQLGVAFDMTVLTDIEDFNYLSFVSTQCHYDAVPKTGATFSSVEEINKWLDSRGCGGRVVLNDNKPEKDSNLYADGKTRLDIPSGAWKEWKVIGNHGAYNQYVSTDITNADGSITVKWASAHVEDDKVPGQPPTPRVEYYQNVLRRYSIDSVQVSAKVMLMYANSANFPDVNVTEVIESIENTFGVRFCYDPDTNKVTVKLLRDMFRRKDRLGNVLSPVKFQGIVTEIHKKTENIRGVRARYSAESDAQEQRDNIRYGKRDYNTDYDYVDYPDGRTEIASYADLTAKIDVGNMRGYADLATGNFYRIKVSADASTADELQPAIFEVGQFHGVEEGDCSKQADDDDAIREIVSNFEPVIVNDVDFRGKNYEGEYIPTLVPFIDEDMEHEFLIKKMLNPVSVKWGSVDFVYELCLCENYDPTQTDDGQSPLQHHDWGLTIGFLRPGSGVDNIVNYDENYDNFGNYRWRIDSSSSAITSDTMDAFGNAYRTSDAGSFSLKPRAWKPFLYYIKDGVTHVTPYSDDLVGQPVEGEVGKTWLIPCNDDERNAHGIITKRLRSRGYVDTFLIEYIHFLLNRQRYEIKAQCTAAELSNIPLNWDRFYDVDGKIGLFNEFQYEVNEETGIGEVTIDFFAI